jgi:hypothetical protein
MVRIKRRKDDQRGEKDKQNIKSNENPMKTSSWRGFKELENLLNAVNKEEKKVQIK